MTINKKISDLRDLMKKNKIDAYIIPSTDAHQSEYIAEHWMARYWISGFLGSAGVVVVTQGFAGLWTDSRYFIQAENELKDSEIELVKLNVPHTPEYIEWISYKLKKDNTVGFSQDVFSVSAYRQMVSAFDDKGIHINSNIDLINEIWKNRPQIPINKILIHDIKFAGKTVDDKVLEVRKIMKKRDFDYHIISSLDDIAWLYNIRGNDIDYNPLAIAFAIISQNNNYLFIDEQKIDNKAKEFFKNNSITVYPYENITEFIKNIENSKTVLLSPEKTNVSIYKSIPKHCKIIESTNIVTQLKASKNKIEIKNIKETMVKDGVALVKFYIWLENNIGKIKITEYSIAEKLKEYRAEQEGFVGESFPSIVGYNENGAIIHYSANKESAKEIKAEGILLIDSGGQYLGGTTDITRTIALGEATEKQKRDFTLVLKGNINLSQAKFPSGTNGYQLDILARKALWDAGMNYGHGTGHGVGYFLNVHEGPQNIGIRPVNQSIMAGMVSSNEPGLYRENQYGIRIENLILAKQSHETEFGIFLEFETLTLFPIDINLIDKSILTKKEIKWINNYHKKVYDNLKTQLDSEEQKWLKNRIVSL